MLRPYQQEAVEGLRASWRAGHQRILLQLPTGAGKTICAAEVIRGAVAKGNPVLFAAHRRELIHQCAAKLQAASIPHGIILAGEPPNPFELVQVASIQTLSTRAFGRGTLELPEASVIIIDEAHRALSSSYVQLAEAYPHAAILGLTATPVRSDGRGLGHLFTDMVLGPTIPDLTATGYLVPVRYFAPSMPDLYGIKLVAGDYQQDELDARMDRPKLVGDVVANWGDTCPERKTVVFATSIKHSIHLAEEFRASGVEAAHLDGETPLHERRAMLEDLSSGRLQVITNCMVLCEGWDQPDVSCAVLARPTKSLGLFLQMAGRVIRPAPGKCDTVIIDHSGSVYQHGFLEEPFAWSLDPRAKIDHRERERKERQPSMITCQECLTAYRGQRFCPSCGWAPPERTGQGVQQIEGRLGELSGAKARVGRHEYDENEKRQWFQMLKYQQQSKGYKPGWPAVIWKAKFGSWPPNHYQDLSPVYPSIEVARYIRSQFIRYAKGRERSEEHVRAA